ncbi:MAG: Na/Pi cotransporter family protein [Candidatus Diapherotrites archaeon]|nr:Na/Pi cotransporter family protein [Candidatus Diapherotrites archaeon]
MVGLDFVPIIFGIVGGLALFLYGMVLLSNSLQKAAGERLRYWIERLTKSKVRGIVVGAAITAVIQSSSATTVTLVGLINAGLITLEQSIPVIMGANIGTTVTAQLVAFKIGAFVMPIIALGFAMSMLCRKPLYKYLGEVILGFGLLFLGMNVMSDGVRPLQEDAWVIAQLASFGATPVLGIIAGAVFTGIIQSSSATSGLVIAMASQGLLGLPAAIALMIGANIGTCVTVLIASVGLNISSKRAALSHLIFNIVGAAIFFVLFWPFVSIVAMTASDLPRQIANAHLLFNVSTTIVLFSFVGALVFVVKTVIPGKEVRIEGGVKFLDERTLNMPGVALSQAEKEVERMGAIALSTLEDSIKAFKENDLALAKVVEKKERSVDELDDFIGGFLSKVTRLELSNTQAPRADALIHVISDIERISDHANNIGEIAERKIKDKLVFSRQALQEIEVMFVKSRDSYRKALLVIPKKDPELARKVSDIESEIDDLTKQFEQNHFERLESGKCNPKAGVAFTQVLQNLESISDHAKNIAVAVSHGF